MLNALIEFSKSLDLADVGLAIHDELRRNGYDCTPANCLTFASTGGDGVHFSIIETLGTRSPVVMTVPMNFSEENLIIADSIYEFLCLGCKYGYFALEGLVYDFEETVLEIEECNTLAYSDLEDEKEAQLLSALSDAFNLRPIANVTSYITEANQKHSASLILKGQLNGTQ